MEAGACFELAQREYMPKIRTYASKVWYFVPGYEQEDLEAELLETLWKVTLAYHPDNGASFNTFFWRSAKNRTYSLERHAKAFKRFAEWVKLDPEEFIAVVDKVVQEFSAEDVAIANLTLVSHFKWVQEQV